MRAIRIPILILFFSVYGCVNPVHSQPRAPWTTGFWFWEGSAVEAAPSGVPQDVVFFHAGTIEKSGPGNEPWWVDGDIPADLPPAREYWLVFRYEHQQVPEASAAPFLARKLSELILRAQQRKLNVAGVQLDIDSPTGALLQYAGLIRELRKGLPPGTHISITALLDWFREGTSIADVIAQTDEFVPQFYDVGNPESGVQVIAAKIDAARWAPVFNRFGKQYRIGISTFGRALFESAPNAVKPVPRPQYITDLTPIDIAVNPDFKLETTRTDAGEVVLNYRPTRETKIEYRSFHSGDTLRFILPVPDVIHAAVENAKQMQGNSIGVVFFRWPTSGETLSLRPDEVMAAAGLANQGPAKAVIRAVDGGCVAVSCVDLYLLNPEFSAQALRYRIRSSVALQYFLPQKRMPVRMTGPSVLDLSVPPYCGRGRLYLGRAVTPNTSTFTAGTQP